MINRKSDAQLQAELESVDAAIATHELASEPATRAHAIIEAIGKDNKELLERELAEQELPDLEELGRIQLRGSASWWKLHRDRNRVVKRSKSSRSRA
jgi:hypothetical protein